MRFRTLQRLGAVIVLSTLVLPTVVLAAFNQNYILSDSELTDYGSMSVSRIQQFLETQGGGLAAYSTEVEGTTKTAAQIIYDVSRAWSISPKYLLVRLQVEQSLVTTTNPTQYQLDWATGFAVCDSCSTNDPSIQAYRGFANQVTWAGRRITEKYLPDIDANGTTFTGWGPGVTKTTAEGDVVTPVNSATASLYTYTPHVHGNYLIWTLWNRWFTRHYPDGSLLQEDSGGVWLIQNGKKRPFLSRSAFFSRFGSYQLIRVSKNDLEAYETGTPIKFPNFSLIRIPSGQTYLLDGDTKRRIVSPAVFRTLGFNPEEIIQTTTSETADYPEGEPINLQSSYPSGVLLQSKQTGGISFVKNGTRHSIWSREILNSNFRNRKPIIVDESSITQYPSGDPVFFRDGELVTAPGEKSVYFISNGAKRPIASKDVFDTLGFKWKNVIRTSPKALEVHPTGDPVTLSEPAT